MCSGLSGSHFPPCDGPEKTTPKGCLQCKVIGSHWPGCPAEAPPPPSPLNRDYADPSACKECHVSGGQHWPGCPLVEKPEPRVDKCQECGGIRWTHWPDCSRKPKALPPPKSEDLECLFCHEVGGHFISCPTLDTRARASRMSGATIEPKTLESFAKIDAQDTINRIHAAQERINGVLKERKEN